MNSPGKYILWSLVLMAFWTQSCSTTKYLPEDEVLYLGTHSLKFYSSPDLDKESRVKHRIEKSEGVIQNLWVKPNGGLFGLPFIRFLPARLYFYNAFYTEQDSTFSKWMMENFGEPPLSISEVNPEARVLFIENYLFNRGYFEVDGSYELKYKKDREPNKAWILYSFVIPDAYRYRNLTIRLDSAQEVLRPFLDNYMEHSQIIPGEPFNLDALAREKKFIWEHLQNEGFFHLREDQILIVADSTVGDKQVDLEYSIQAEKPDRSYQEVYVRDIQVKMNEDLKLKKHLLESAMAIEPESKYSYEDSRKTIRNLTGLGIFKEPVITYQQVSGDSSKVNALIELYTTDRFSLGINSDMNIKNTSYIGPDLGITATQKNLFGGAEHLTFSLSGYLDFPYGVMSHRVSRSYGYKAGARLSSPVRRFDFLSRHAATTPRKFVSLHFEQNRRIDYFTITEWKAATGLSWHASKRVSHQINLVNVTYANLVDTTAAFSAMLDEKPAARNSYRDQFLIGPSYTFTFNNTLEKTRRFMTYYRLGVETSGNLLNGIQRLAGKSGEDKEFLGVKYSQYLRMLSDFRVYFRLGEGKSQLVFRNILGFGNPYGNSSHLPYTRQFYIGGSNSLRPLTARVVGPGRYLEFDEAAYNQVGDIKIENNLEYRFKIWYVLYGALWGDLGNIWLSKEDLDRPGSGIRFNSILRDSYFTAGGGLRIDLDFLVIRADYGALLYAPFFNPGYHWIWQNELPLHGLVFGIGYPF